MSEEQSNKFEKLTPGRAIRKFCVACVGSYSEVEGCKGDKLCDGTVCNFFKYRMGKGRPSVKTIRKECLRCMGGSFDLVAGCVSETCPIHKYRYGKNPNYHLDGGPGLQKLAEFRRSGKPPISGMPEGF